MDFKKHWNKTAQELLVGRTIRAVSYMTDEELDSTGWDQRAVMIEFDNGLCIFPSRDDEGNGPGALFTSDEKTPILPVI